jgi:hypothetical protein
MPRRRNSYDDYNRDLNAWGNHQDYLREMAESEEHEAAMEAWRLANPEAAAKRDAEQAEWDLKWAKMHAAEVAAEHQTTEPSTTAVKPATVKPAARKPATASPKPKVTRAGLLEQEDGWTKVMKRR